MFKIALAVFVTLSLIAAPAAEARTRAPGATAKKQAATKTRAKVRAADIAGDSRERLVKRVTMVRGKRVVSYVRVRSANTNAVAAPTSAGDRAGLNLTRDPLDLKSNVALV